MLVSCIKYTTQFCGPLAKMKVVVVGSGSAGLMAGERERERGGGEDALPLSYHE
jgi:ribulose 1,5-bisphosphate synthetase/thiazole synthase